MPARKRISKKTIATPPPTDTAPDPVAIAARAYFLFLERGGVHGRDWDDWLQAERDLQSTSSASAATER